MDSPSYAHVPDWSRGCVRGLQGGVKPETGFKPQSRITRITARGLVETHRQVLSEGYAMVIQAPKTTLVLGGIKDVFVYRYSMHLRL